MSYSFSIAATDKIDALAKVSEKLNEVAASQPSHQADLEAAEDVAYRYLELLRPVTENEQITVNMSGLLGWDDTEQTSFTSANVNFSADISPKV